MSDAAQGVALSDEEIEQAFCFLPDLLSLIKSLEIAVQAPSPELVGAPMHSLDTQALPSWAADATQLASNFQKKITAAKQLLNEIPGAEYTIQEQQSLFEEKKKTLESKRYVLLFAFSSSFSSSHSKLLLISLHTH